MTNRASPLVRGHGLLRGFPNADVPGGLSPIGGGGATIVVAASNSPLSVRKSAHFVARGSSDECTINQAIKALPPGGGSIRLAAGKYRLGSDPVQINRSWVNLFGDGFGFWLGFGGNYPIADPEGPGITLIECTGTTDAIDLLDPYGVPVNYGARLNGISFHDLYLYGSGHTGGVGINCLSTAKNVDQMIIERMFCHNFSDGMDITLDSGRVLNSTVMDCGGAGINVTASYGVMIGFNCISDIGGNGIDVAGTGSGNNGCIIFSNELVRNNGGGSGASIQVESSVENAVVNANVVISSGNDGIDCFGPGVSITGNTVNSPAAIGISAQSTDTTIDSVGTISGNTIYNSGARSIFASSTQAQAVTIQGNAISQNGNVGIDVDGCSGVSVNGNSIIQVVTGFGCMRFGINNACHCVAVVGNAFHNGSGGTITTGIVVDNSSTGITCANVFRGTFTNMVTGASFTNTATNTSA